MQPIDNFYLMFEERTSGAVAKYLQISKNLFSVIITVSIIVLVISLISFIVLRQQIEKREMAQNELDALNNELEQKVAERTEMAEKSEAKMKESLQELEKTNKFMVGRELKMIELKKQIKELGGQE